VTARTVPAAAVEQLLAAIHSTLPEQPPAAAGITGPELVRVLADSLLRRGVDEYSLRGAVIALRDTTACMEVTT